jgi:peptidyl-prolyl cis-trans isomerase C
MNQSLLKTQILSYFFIPVLLSHATFGYAAEPGVLVTGQGVRVTKDDLNVEAQRMPLESRKGILSKPDNVSQTASNLFVRRALAAEAEVEGLQNKPSVAAAIQIAKDRILSEARLAQLDEAAKPTDKALEKFARAKYKAEPQRFLAPEQTRASHILIATTVQDAKEKAEKIRQDILAGSNFEELAKQHSADPGSAAKGGDLGLFAKGKMVKPFEEALDQLQRPGDLSPVVETQFGFHIIKLTERRPAGRRSYDEVKDELYREAISKILSDARVLKVEKILSDAKFERTAIEAFAETQR